MLCDICCRTLEGTSDPGLIERVRNRQNDNTHVEGEQLEIEKYLYGHHRTRRSLSYSSRSECSICRLLYIGEGRLCATKPFEDTRYWSVMKVSVKEDVVTVEVYTDDASNSCAFVPVDNGTNITLQLPTYTDSQQSWALIRRWVSNCTTTHDRCWSQVHSEFLPTRMLEIENMEEPVAYRLVNGCDCPKSIRYTALSYCWGSAPASTRLRLLDSTVRSLRQKNVVGNLPKTYRDAIRVTARLGVKYLWIDSLCIFQDSKADWLNEASRMRDVYKNSYLTISALSGRNDHSGLFYSRDTTSITPAVVPLRLSHGPTSSFYRSKTESLRRLEIWNEDGVTTHRGWCLQERLLSPRTLHYGKRQIFWECHEQCASDLRPETIYSGPIVPGASGLWKHLIGGASVDTDGAGTRKLLESWYNTMVIYSDCNLSFASDKLVAIAGLADDMKRALDAIDPLQPYTYVLGLWQRDLAQGLCWTARKETYRPSTFRLPTWTWASTIGQISFHFGHQGEKFIPLLNQEEIHVDGEAEDTSLSLVGRVIKIYHVESQSTTMEIGEFESFFQHGNTVEYEWLLSHGHLYVIVYDEDKDDIEEVYLMPLGVKESEDEDQMSRLNFFGLVMAPVDGRSDVFRRVGLLETYRTPRLKDIHPMNEVYEPDLAEKFLDRFTKKRIALV